MTLRQYMNLIREMDNNYQHPTYVRAAKNIVKVCTFEAKSQLLRVFSMLLMQL